MQLCRIWSFIEIGADLGYVGGAFGDLPDHGVICQKYVAAQIIQRNTCEKIKMSYNVVRKN